MGSPINDPHPNDVAVEEPDALQEPEDFFAPEENGEAAPTLEPREPGDDSPIEAGELPEGAPATLAEPVAADELEAADPADFAEPEESDEEDEPEASSEPDEDGSDDDEPEDDETGNKREYVVLQEVVLDQEVLNELLKAVKSGEDAMVALIEVHRVRVTNPKSALNGAWRRHKSEWVEPPRLAVVTANKIRTRKAKPRVREVIGFEFE